MNVTCAHCGAFNRDGAKFCQSCGGPLPAAAVLPVAAPLPAANRLPSAVMPPQPQVPQPAYPAPVAATPAPAPQPVTMPKARLFQRAPILVGRVNVVDPERQEKTPFDAGRALVMFAFICLIAGVFVSFAAAGMVVGIVLLLLGVGVGLLGCLAGVLLLPVKLILGPIINFIRGEPTVAVLNFQVLDSMTGAPVDVLLYRKPGSGNVRLGDVVQINGAMQRGSNVARARRVRVIESGGRATDYKIDALKPWPLWVGLLILALAVAGALKLAGVI